MQILFTLADAKSSVADRERFEELARFVYLTQKDLEAQVSAAIEKIHARSVVAGQSRAVIRGKIEDDLTDWADESFDVREFMDAFLPACLAHGMDADAFRVMALGRLNESSNPGCGDDELDELVIARLPSEEVKSEHDCLLAVCALAAAAGKALLESVQA